MPSSKFERLTKAIEAGPQLTWTFARHEPISTMFRIGRNPIGTNSKRAFATTTRYREGLRIGYVPGGVSLVKIN